MLKRYQFYSPEGIQWTPWFKTDEHPKHWQLKNKLKNQYKQ